ncbi:MAG: acetylornithine/N-succinyldiaminopimelate aminotransferase [Bradymonadia bacterium]|jgi:acetylornithine/N-succinyldiaminopimelate aminotransferase
MTQKLTTHSSAELIGSGRSSMSLSYNPQPLVFSHGEGMWLVDREGNRYLDFLAGIAVCTLGHSHPKMVEALQDQVSKLLHVSNAYFTEPQILLQEKIVEKSFGDRVFFCNSGAEANEAAIKLARRYQSRVRNTPRFEVITFEKSFHGRTMGALSATAQPKYHDGFEPMVPGFLTAPYGDLAAVEALMGDHTAAILVEPVQGEGGIRPGSPEFLRGLRALCDAHGVLLIVDEVQCGVGRTGDWFGYEQSGITPDIMALAKGVGGGTPLGAMVATAEVAEGFQRGSHATTYGGNPLTTRAGLVVFDVIERDGLLEQVGRVGEYVRERSAELVASHGAAIEVRGRGLMNGLALDVDASVAGAVVAAARERGLLLNTAGGTVLRLVPPLIADERDVDDAMDRLHDAMGAVL